MIPEKPQAVDGISRRRMLKRIGAGAAVAWTAPILTSIRTPAFAQSGESPCDPGAPCDINTPCNVAIACHNGNPLCNCWVNADHNACFCGDLDACSNHQPCGPGNSCPSGQVCVDNCCGLLCYAPCSNVQGKAPKRTGREYGVR
jgi:hypothetical protein